MTSLLIGVGLMAGAADSPGQEVRRRMAIAALVVLLFNLLLFVPAALWAIQSDVLYDLSDWLETEIGQPCRPTPGALFEDLSTNWHKRKLNRSVGVLLASASWLYQWIYVLPWVVWGRWRSVPNHLTWERGLLWGAGLTALMGLPFSLWIIWDGLRCSR